MNDRYTVCHPDTGLVESASTLAAAFAIADRVAEQQTAGGRPMWSDPYAFEVYDRMAHRGRPRRWARRRRNESHDTIRGDRLTDDAAWLVVGIRPESERTLAERRSGTT